MIDGWRSEVEAIWLVGKSNKSMVSRDASVDLYLSTVASTEKKHHWTA